jgi:hypothetical protein
METTGKQEVGPTKNGGIAANDGQFERLKDFIMNIVNDFLEFLKRCEISKVCKDVEKNLAAFRTFKSISALVMAYKDAYEKDAESAVKHWMSKFEFKREHFSDSEWSKILKYNAVIFKAVITEMDEMNKM